MDQEAKAHEHRELLIDELSDLPVQEFTQKPQSLMLVGKEKMGAFCMRHFNKDVVELLDKQGVSFKDRSTLSLCALAIVETAISPVKASPNARANLWSFMAQTSTC